jgi:hypothetical protein
MTSSGSSGSGSGGGGNASRRVRLDEALSAWPMPERTAVEWDESAEAVMARLEGAPDEGDEQPAGVSGVSDEDLLGAPLPPSSEEMTSSAPLGRKGGREGASMSQASSSSRQRDRANLKELAKMAEMTAPATPGTARKSRPSYPNALAPAPAPASGSFEAKDEPVESKQEPKAEREENSGIIHLAAMAAEEKAADPKPAVAQAAPGVAKAAAAVAARIPAAEPPRRRGAQLYFIGTFIAAAAVAAGVFVTMRRPAPDLAAPVAAVPAPVQATPAVPTVAASAAPVTPIAAADKGVDPSTLPPAVDTSGAPHLSPSGLAAPKTGLAANAPAAAPAAPTPAPAPTQDPKLVAVVPSSTAAPGDDKSLQALMQQAAGVTPGSSAPAAAQPSDPSQGSLGSVPLKPSQGAVSGALGAVLSGARACLGPDDPISRVQVTFQSDGSVQSVSVSGGAAGKPAEACIRSALMRARVAPFASPTFTAPATIRPN